MRNPFKLFQEYVKKTPRNSFDLSHRNNLTLPPGLLIPDLVLDVAAGSSHRIESAFAFNFLPMMFPIQVPIRINQYFFFVRYRNTWDHYMDFRYGNKEYTHPYLDQPAEFFRTCSLADYMGIPTTLARGEAGYLAHFLTGRYAEGSVERVDISDFVTGALDNEGAEYAQNHISVALAFLFDKNATVTVGHLSSEYLFAGSTGAIYVTIRFTEPAYRIKSIQMPFAAPSGNDPNIVLNVLDNSGIENVTPKLLAVESTGERRVLLYADTGITMTASAQDSHQVDVALSSSLAEDLNALLEDRTEYDLFIVFQGLKDVGASILENFFVFSRCALYVSATRAIDIADHPELNPFCSYLDHEPVLRINALPFRAYEQIYNYIFRNDRVEPFIKDGEVEYNDFGTTYADGADSTPYELKRRNWELDMFTSCLPSPMQGTAPIVGVDARHITFSDGEREYNFAYQTDSNGQLIADGSKFEEEVVPGSVRSRAVDLIANGFTIESLREANAATIWLEKNYRRGLRYKDQLKAHTGIDLDWDELDVPEFLGGYSRYVDVSSITSSAATEGAVLGDVAGQAGVFKKGEHAISHFFREDGVVIGLVCIVPQPVYTQHLYKFWLRSSPLDYYNSEFSHIGMQPVPYAEVSPVQMYNEMQHGGERTMESVFGYNRPNYDMVSRVDEAHGLMRTSDRDFLMMRTFEGVPELGADFLHVDGRQVNDVFTITDPDGHIARGQVAFKIYSKMPVPLTGQPRLEP